MKRKYTKINNHVISYLDNEKSGQVMMCLHGLYGCGSMFTFFEKIYDGRLILLDQRGHGQSDKTATYTRFDYVDDIIKFVMQENIERPILLGHSLGGVNAYQYAAMTKNVKLLIIEDIGTEIHLSNDVMLQLPVVFDSLYDAQKAFETIKMSPGTYFFESIRYDGEQWKFIFNYDDMVISQQALNGSYWDEWEKVTCPILLLHGKKSWACTTENIMEMARRNRQVKLIMYDDVMHVIRDAKREEYCHDVVQFIRANSDA